MSLSYVLADSLTRIRNAQAVMLKEVELLYSGLVMQVVEIMKDEGYLIDYKRVEISKGISRIVAILKYYNRKGVIKDVKVFSRPGRRVYVPCSKIQKLYNGLGVSILSTSKGVITDRQAVQMGVGGELLCGLF